MVGIEFTMEGARELKRKIEADHGAVIGIPPEADGRRFGIYMVSVYPGRSGASMETKTYQRSLPRAKRDDMIRYANRAYGQYRRKGGRLA